MLPPPVEHDLNIVTPSGAYTPGLYKACASGLTIGQVELMVIETRGARSFPVSPMTLSETFVSGFDWRLFPQISSAWLCQISFNFASIQIWGRGVESLNWYAYPKPIPPNQRVLV